MNERLTQCVAVIDFIKRNGSITAFEAQRDLGIMRLASRINDLKRKGVPIVRTTVVVQNRFGRDCRIAKYTIAAPPVEKQLGFDGGC